MIDFKKADFRPAFSDIIAHICKDEFKKANTEERIEILHDIYKICVNNGTTVWEKSLQDVRQLVNMPFHITLIHYCGTNIGFETNYNTQYLNLKPLNKTFIDNNYAFMKQLLKLQSIWNINDSSFLHDFKNSTIFDGLGLREDNKAIMKAFNIYYNAPSFREKNAKFSIDKSILENDYILFSEIPLDLGQKEYFGQGNFASTNAYVIGAFLFYKSPNFLDMQRVFDSIPQKETIIA